KFSRQPIGPWLGGCPRRRAQCVKLFAWHPGTYSVLLRPHENIEGRSTMPLPSRQGLYDPAFEHDACGLGFVAKLRGEATHEIVKQGLEILENLTHRGAAGCDPCTGDGAGVLLQLPHEFYKDELAKEGIELPPPGDYAVAMCFFSRDPAKCRHQQAIL